MVGKPLAVYMGDDSRNEYIYKFVSTATWVAADASAADRIAIGDKYLDAGKLYVAKFNADGTGQWIELDHHQRRRSPATPATPSPTRPTCWSTRASPPTRSARPRWTVPSGARVHPTTGEIYFTLTNNSNRSVEPSPASQLGPDAANPRVYTDIRGAATVQPGNVNGHIIRIEEAGGEPAATTFTWDIYLFGAEAGAPTRHRSTCRR